MAIQQHIKRFLSVVVLLCFGVINAKASHLFGGEIFYTNVSGNTYKVTLVLYGDCAASSVAGGPFSGLTTATPTVQVYNGTTLVTTLTLSPQAGSGVNVSPVCPDEVNNTTCTPNGTLPGIKKFIYAVNYTLSGASANWRFRMTGDLGNSQAGRTNAITNAVIPGAGSGGSLISLEATLNNATANNNSPTYTTIPTPFFCINKPQEYNQGAVDSDNDSLSFALVPGLVGNTNPSTNITYIAPYTATAPLGCTPGTFAFNNISGQLSFTPNVLQDALVVSKVSEYRNGVLVGTSMREMTFLVLNNCNNNPPDGPVANPVSGGTLDSNNTIKICASGGTVSFQIHPTDVDGDNITIASQGIPTGAVTTITGNNTTAPVFTFSWNINSVAPGTYNFFLTFTDDGCPLVSKQSVAYTIKVMPKPGLTYALITNPTCTQKGVFSITPVGVTLPYTFTATQGVTNVLTRNNINAVITDSLSAGTYTFSVTNVEGCKYDTTISLIAVNQIYPQIAFTQPLCPGAANGTITVTATGVNPPFTYAIGTQAFAATNSFTGLAAGTYALHIKDAGGCTKDTTVTITNPLAMQLALNVKKPVCSPVSNGQVIVTVTNGVAPYQYAVNTGAYGTSNTLTGLSTGTHTLHIKDANNCIKDTTITLTDSLHMAANIVITPIQCFGDANGVITVTGSGTVAPYTYAVGSGTFSTTNTFSNLGQGTFVIHLSDVNGCLKDTTISLVQPAVLAFSLTLNHVLCFGESTGSVLVNATGGTPAYQYAVDAGAFQASNFLSGLTAGQHTIHLKDAHNCLKDTSIIITQPAVPFTFTGITINNPTCEGVSDGSANAIVSGGVAPYQYGVDGGGFGSSSNFASLLEGTHTITVIDNNGCTIDTAITLVGYPHINVLGFDFKLPSCYGNTDGAITVNAGGGLPPFTYRINNGNTWSAANTFSNLEKGNYLISIKDMNGCVKDTTVTLSEPDAIVIDTSLVGNDCNGVDNGGVIDIQVSGGTAPFQYDWAHNANLHDSRIAGLENGTYTVIVTDANGCTNSASIEILYNNCCTPFIPNVFSPNGDGKNDSYKVEYKGDMDLKEMSIYNRFGQRVFNSSNVSKAWDGTFNGQAVDGGTYFYYVRILCGNVAQKELIFKGDVTLIR